MEARESDAGDYAVGLSGQVDRVWSWEGGRRGWTDRLTLSVAGSVTGLRLELA